MEDYKRGSHTVWDCKYHLVWVTKYSYEILAGDVGQRCRELLREIARSKEMQEAERCIDHLVKGIGDAQRVGARSKELAIEEAKVRAELAKAPPALKVVNLHPAVLARYETQIANLQTADSGVLAAGDTKAAEALRELVDSVVVSRDPNRVGGVIVEITGRLNALLGEKAWPNGVRSSVGSMVAEERFGFERHKLLPLGLWMNENGNVHSLRLEV